MSTIFESAKTSEARTATIKIGSKTKNHGTWLNERGYTVTESNGTFVLSNVTIVESEKPVDFSTGEKFLEACRAQIAQKGVWTYKQRFDFGDTILWGIAATGRMGVASALVASPQKNKLAGIAASL